VFQDLPEFFEDNMKCWMEHFHTLLTTDHNMLSNQVSHWQQVVTLKYCLCLNLQSCNGEISCQRLRKIVTHNHFSFSMKTIVSCFHKNLNSNISISIKHIRNRKFQTFCYTGKRLYGWKQFELWTVNNKMAPFCQIKAAIGLLMQSVGVLSA